MSAILVVVGMIAAVNGPRTRLGVPEGPGGAARTIPLVGGAVIALAVVAGLAGVSQPLFDGLDITDETFRIAAGFVALLAAFRTILRPIPGPEPEMEGVGAALWPVAFPRLLSPEIVALALAVGAAEGVGLTLLATAIGMVVLVALAPVARSATSERVLAGLGRLLAVPLVLFAVYVLIEGIRDV